MSRRRISGFYRQKKLNRSFAATLVLFLLLSLFGAFMALPLVYTINNAFKPLLYRS
ncbi:hypothetical protein Clst_0668 [Thermoclostridium stercorarium subsp. stercorarium DSM 8532]|nr:hypothetical protein Clst_0668 [Thermoclostridium stercorarium subsp. stercorarium DSM 8532]